MGQRRIPEEEAVRGLVQVAADPQRSSMRFVNGSSLPEDAAVDLAEVLVVVLVVLVAAEVVREVAADLVAAVDRRAVAEADRQAVAEAAGSTVKKQTKVEIIRSQPDNKSARDGKKASGTSGQARISA